MPQQAVKDTYPVRTDVSLDVQQALLDEQADRQKDRNNRQRVSLMTIAAEWLEEIAKQKQEAAKLKQAELA